MKHLFIICLQLVVFGSGYGQDSLKKDILLPIVKEFSTNSSRFEYFKQLPEYIRSQLDQVTRIKKFKISKRVDSGKYISGLKRKLHYILKLKDNYLLGYDHGGGGHHFHSVIFVTNGKEITNIYNLIIANTHQGVSELEEHIEKNQYYIQEMTEF